MWSSRPASREGPGEGPEVVSGPPTAEAEAARIKADALENVIDIKRAQALKILRECNWEAAAATGIVDGLHDLPPWTPQTEWRRQLLVDFASSRDHLDPWDLATQIKFVSEDLRNTFIKVGANIQAAKTPAEATKEFRCYSDKLRG